MKHARITRLIAVPALIGVLPVSLLVAAAPARGDTQTRPLTIHTVGPPQSEICLVPGPDGLCATLQETSTVTSTLAGQGTSQLTLIRTFLTNGCFTADELTTFTFDAGMISTHTSLPASCAPPKGLLFNAPFVVTGGTGAFAGATGSGHEFNSPGPPSPVIYIGTITF